MELFTDPVTKPNGDAYKATVPSKSELDYYVDSGDPEDVVITVDDIETETEEITLEMLNYKWQSRQIKVNIRNDSPYHSHDSKTIRKDVLLPPKAISLVFQQLDELAGKLGFLAESNSGLPKGGFKEVSQDG